MTAADAATTWKARAEAAEQRVCELEESSGMGGGEAVVVTAASVEVIAKVCHEANRAWCESNDDLTQTSWDQAPNWQRESAVDGVWRALVGQTPEQSHEAWLAEKERTGWRFGSVKNVERKEHPCFVPYDQLPPRQRVKDSLFVAIVEALAPAFGHDGEGSEQS